MVSMSISHQSLPGGMVVMFEGLDGSGKTTQLTMARRQLEEAGWTVLATRNLGGTPIGEALREVMLSSVERPPMTDLYTSLAIQEALLEEIDKARNAGKIVLLDRGPLSLAAYQIYGRGVGEGGWHYVEEGMKRFQPEMVILYEIDAATALARARHVGPNDYFESKPQSYFEEVARGFDMTKSRFNVDTIDAGKTIDDIHTATMEIIERALQDKLSPQPIQT